jgi:hypothetical protein
MKDGDDRVEELRAMFHVALAALEPEQLSNFVDYYLEWYMGKEGVKEITKFKGIRELRRVCDAGHG